MGPFVNCYLAMTGTLFDNCDKMTPMRK